MQSVFKVDLKLGQRERPFYTRRAHRKSRGGCVECKRTRYKCDESKPSCWRCLRASRPCVYAGPEAQTCVDVQAALQLTPHSGDCDMVVQQMQVNIDEILGYSLGLCPTGSQKNASVRALQYFHAATSRTLGGGAIGRVIEGIVRKTAQTTPYLLHMVLAVSTAHLRRLTSGNGSPKNQRCLRITEAVHWQKGLQLYQDRLAQGYFGHEFDSMVATAFLAILFSFAMDDEVPSDAYTTAGAGSRSPVCGPWAAISGFRALNCVRKRLSPESAFASIVNSTHDDTRTVETIHSDVDVIIPAAFANLCELTPSSPEATNPYYRIVHLLSPLLQMESKVENTTKLLAFIGRTWGDLQPLLLRKDTRALLLLSWWLTLLEQVNQWWVITRARTECRAVVEYLLTCSDPMVQALLIWPASQGSVDCSWIWTQESSLSGTRVEEGAVVRAVPSLTLACDQDRGILI